MYINKQESRVLAMAIKVLQNHDIWKMTKPWQLNRDVCIYVQHFYQLNRMYKEYIPSEWFLLSNFPVFVLCMLKILLFDLRVHLHCMHATNKMMIFFHFNWHVVIMATKFIFVIVLVRWTVLVLSGIDEFKLYFPPGNASDAFILRMQDYFCLNIRFQWQFTKTLCERRSKCRIFSNALSLCVDFHRG